MSPTPEDGCSTSLGLREHAGVHMRDSCVLLNPMPPLRTAIAESMGEATAVSRRDADQAADLLFQAAQEGDLKEEEREARLHDFVHFAARDQDREASLRNAERVETLLGDRVRTDESLWLMQVCLLRRLGRFDDALSVIGKTEAALDAAEETEETQAMRGEMMAVRGELLEDAGRQEEADEALAKAVEMEAPRALMTLAVKRGAETKLATEDAAFEVMTMVKRAAVLGDRDACVDMMVIAQQQGDVQSVVDWCMRSNDKQCFEIASQLAFYLGDALQGDGDSSPAALAAAKESLASYSWLFSCGRKDMAHEYVNVLVAVGNATQDEAQLKHAADITKFGAQMGNRNCQFVLGVLSHPDFRKAAGEKELSMAMSFMGSQYLSLRPFVDVDEAAGLQLIQTSATAGDARAHAALAFLCAAADSIDDAVQHAVKVLETDPTMYALAFVIENVVAEADKDSPQLRQAIAVAFEACPPSFDVFVDYANWTQTGPEIAHARDVMQSALQDACPCEKHRKMIDQVQSIRDQLVRKRLHMLSEAYGSSSVQVSREKQAFLAEDPELFQRLDAQDKGTGKGKGKGKGEGHGSGSGSGKGKGKGKGKRRR